MAVLLWWYLKVQQVSDGATFLDTVTNFLYIWWHTASSIPGQNTLSVANRNTLSLDPDVSSHYEVSYKWGVLGSMAKQIGF